ncbi:MAG: hypothetical protein ACOYB4_00750 [Methyloceanibacter sp.]
MPHTGRAMALELSHPSGHNRPWGTIMPNVKGAMLATGLLAALLAACSRSEAPPGGILAEQPAATDGSKMPDMRAAAAAACREETRSKGIRSVAAIFSRLRPGKVDEEFNACMRARGYEAEGA